MVATRRSFSTLTGIYSYGDASLSTIWELRYDYATHKVIVHEASVEQPENINRFAEDADGELYVLMLDGKTRQITTPSTRPKTLPVQA